MAGSQHQIWRLIAKVPNAVFHNERGGKCGVFLHLPKSMQVHKELNDLGLS
jgi:hypothetical protein